MPRVVDHGQRREELASAALTLVQREGVAGLSVRNLAAESGWSAGAVRHYLPSHADIVALVTGAVRESFDRRLQAAAARHPAEEQLRALLVAGLPLDDESRTLSQVWFALLGSEVHEPQGAGSLVYEELADALVRVFEGYQAAGCLRSASARTAAVALQAVFDGLTAHLLLGGITPDEALECLDETLLWLVRPQEPGP